MRREDGRVAGGALSAARLNLRGACGAFAAARVVRLAAVFAAFGSVAAAQTDAAPPERVGEGSQTVVVFAAASLQSALEPVAQRFTAATGIETQVAYAGSGALARQIEAGAPAQVFISADGVWVDQLERGGALALATRRAVAGNRLAVIAPRRGAASDQIDWDRIVDGEFDIAARLGPEGRLATALTQSAPLGRYTREALTSLGLWSALSDRLAEAADAPGAAALVARGGASLGVVYLSDARAAVTAGRAEWVGLLPAATHRPIRYEAALVRSAAADVAAAAFLAALSTQATTADFTAAGFSPPPPAEAASDAPRPAFDAKAANADWRAAAISAASLSLLVAATATALCVAPAVAVAYLLARKEFWGKSALDAATHLPLILPPVVTGYALLAAFGRDGVIGAPLEAAFGFSLAFQWTGAAVAAAVMGFPLMVRAVRLAIEAADPRLEEAAAVMGAPPLAQLWTVLAPAAAPGLATGATLCFAKAFGEFGATITFVSSIPGETRTLPSAIFAATQTPGGERAAVALSLVAVGVSVAALVASELLTRAAIRRRKGAA